MIFQRFIFVTIELSSSLLYILRLSSATLDILMHLVSIRQHLHGGGNIATEAIYYS